MQVRGRHGLPSNAAAAALLAPLACHDTCCADISRLDAAARVALPRLPSPCLCSVGGVQSQSITVDRQMRRYDVPRVAFINKLDRVSAGRGRSMHDTPTQGCRTAVAAARVPQRDQQLLHGWPHATIQSCCRGTC